MPEVNIYIETDSVFQGKTDRKCGYVLSTMTNSGEKTKEGFGHAEGTYHQAVLITLSEALERMAVPCQICIHTRDTYVASRIPKLEEMAGSGWRDSKGELIKNGEEMNVNELWGKGWSLKPEQDPRTMECLGTIIRSGTRFTYYKDEQGGIWFEDEPEDGKPEWMQKADKERRRRNRRHS